MPAPMIPLMGWLPDSTPTIDMPNTASMNSSGEPKANTSGRAMGMMRVRTAAPINPPISDAENAEPRARAASPLRARG